MLLLPILRVFAYPLLQLLTAAPPTAAAPPEASTIKLLALYQPPCATLTPQSVVRVRLQYGIGEAEQSAYGFAVSIKFATTDPNRTFSLGRYGQQAVTARHDTLTLQYPMSAILGNQRLKRPVTCYLYLHRNTGERSSAVIARTPPIVFQECM